MRRRLLTLLSLSAIVAGAGGGLTASPAGANTTVRTFIHVDYSDTIEDLCSFPIEEDVQGSFKRVAYFDSDGNIIKVIFTPTGGPLTITWTANGVTATTRSVGTMVLIAFAPEFTFTENGIVFNFVVPGIGAVYQEVGRFVMDSEGNIIFKAGPEGDVDTLCQALSG